MSDSTPAPAQEPIKTLPLVFDEPRGRKKPPRHLADLDEAGRKALLEEMGLPGFRAKQLSMHYFGRLVDDPAQMTDLPATPARRARRGAAARPDDAAAHARGRQGHHAQDALEALRRRARRVRADALPGPRHRLRLQPGRLRHGLPVLRHRPGRSPAQHVDRRDRRAGRRRCPLDGARRGPRRSGPRLQRRVHGHGRAAGQLQGRHRCRAPPRRPVAGRPGHERPRHHGLHGRPRAAHQPADRGGHPGHARAEPARARRRAAQRAGPDQHPLLGRRDRRGGLELRPRHQAPGLDRVRA